MACVRRIAASALRSGLFRHMGISLQGDSPVFAGRIMPDPALGKWSQRNAQGQEIVRKDLPMVTKTFSVEVPHCPSRGMEGCAQGDYQAAPGGRIGGMVPSLVAEAGSWCPAVRRLTIL